MEDCLVIYTDGSSAPNPRKGGVGFRIIFPDGKCKDFSPFGYLGATSNEMELQACILALREVLRIKDIEGINGIVVYTDSQYVVSYYKTALFTWSNPWSKKKWLRSNGEPVLNVPQWKELLRLMRRIWDTFHASVSFEKVEAHSGIQDNEVVDKLAKHSRRGPSSIQKISVGIVRRSKTTKKTVRGSICGKGQRIRIRVVSANWLSVQKLYRLRCEVLSKKSEYFGNMDFILSEYMMRAGHIYDVILMDGLDYCRAKKVLKEIKLN
ncbi:MAG: ribonuclease HI [Patescibacteria group bacterium]|nr:ribonuclease HI [Patescibacteria group bacterium]